MRQWHQGKEGFMKVTRIQDKYNPDKVWMIKRYLCGTFYVNQEIKGQKFYDRDRRMTKRMLVIRMSIGYTVGGTVRQGIILYEAAPKVIETLIEKGYTCDLNGCGMRVYKL